MNRWSAYALALLAVVIALALGPNAPAHPETPYVEHVNGGAAPDARLPLVVLLHGMGDTPSRAYDREFASYPFAARFVVPRAPIRHLEGWAWFRFSGGHPLDAQELPRVVAAAARVDALVTRVQRERPTLGLPVVVGFSEGAVLAYVLALRYGPHYAEVLPLSGFVPPGLLPTSCVHAAPIDATHGEDDEIVPLAWDTDGLAALRTAGCNVQLQVLEGVGHSVPESQLAQVWAVLHEAGDAAQ